MRHLIMFEYWRLAAGFRRRVGLHYTYPPGRGRAAVPTAYERHPIAEGQLLQAVRQTWHPTYPTPARRALRAITAGAPARLQLAARAA